MKMIKIGVLGPSDIAFRRTIPAFMNSDCFTYVGVACASVTEWSDDGTQEQAVLENRKKADRFVEAFGGKVYLSYEEMLADNEIEAVYIPLPPGLHAKWAKRAMENNKHVFLEKPFTECLADTKELIAIASERGLAVHENFAFIFHKQIGKLKELIENGTIGELRLIRTTFSFPYRGSSDFRYHANMGGGALLDCGGYPLKLAGYLLGESARVITSSRCAAKGHDVDVFGSATLENDKGEIAQISYGMDNSYRCELEVFGSEASLYTGRVFTPTADMKTVLVLKGKEQTEIEIEADDQFLHSAEHFYACMMDDAVRTRNYYTILHQSKLMEIR